MDNVEELCDRLAIIHEGRKVLDGTIEEVRRNHFKNEYDLNFSEPISIPEDIKFRNLEQSKSFSIRVTLNNEESYQDLLDWAYKTKKLKAFGEYLPTMHEIFVNKVSNR